MKNRRPASPPARPTSVCMPVAVTNISPRPRITVVFMNPQLRRSPTADAASGSRVIECFSEGTDSPVSAASSIARLFATRNRPSAGNLSPGSRSTMSPGTTSAAGTSRRASSRRTRTTSSSRAASAAMAASARLSCAKPNAAFTSRTTRITIGSLRSPTAADTAAAPSRTYTRALLNWSAILRHSGGGSGCSSRFGPQAERRSAASASPSPRSGSTPRASTSEATLWVAGSRTGLSAGYVGEGPASGGVQVPSGRSSRAGLVIERSGYRRSRCANHRRPGPGRVRARPSWISGCRTRGDCPRSARRRRHPMRRDDRPEAWRNHLSPPGAPRWTRALPSGEPLVRWCTSVSCSCTSLRHERG